MKIKIVLFSVAIITLQSCATLLSGTTDRVVFNTTPPNAEVYIDGERKGVSGEDIILKRRYKSSRDVKLIKEGFEDVNFVMEQKIAGPYWCGLAGLGIPMWIDIATGAALMPKQKEFTRILTPKK